MELKLPSGGAVEIRISDSTLRLVLKNPLIVKVFEGVAKEEKPDITEADALKLWENLDNIIARVVSEPRFYVPQDLDDKVPPGMVSIEQLDTADKMAIWVHVIAASGEVMNLAPFRNREGRSPEPGGDG